MSLCGDDLRAALYCCAALLRARQHNGEPIPRWLWTHFERLDAAVRTPPQSEPGHESSAPGEQSQSKKLIDAREAATILGCSPRQARRLAPDLDGQLIGDRWLFHRDVVTEYADERRHRGGSATRS